MGFFALEAQNGGTGSSFNQYSDDLLYQLRCKACPLNNGYLEPIGPDDAEIYLLGEFPTNGEVAKDKPFMGKSGKYLRNLLGKDNFNSCRAHNTIRCHPEGGNEPQRLELESCRPFIEEDIAYVKPKVIVGLGKIPLKWITKDSSATVTNWRGRWTPVCINGHYCWYMQTYDPKFIMQNWKYIERKQKYLPSIFDQPFERDLASVFEYVNEGKLSDPKKQYEEPDDIYKGIEIFEGNSGGEFLIEQVREALEWAKEQPIIGVDIETNGLSPFSKDSRLVTISFGTYNYSFCYPLDWPGLDIEQSQLNKLHELTKDFILNSGKKVAHSLQFELLWFVEWYGKEVITNTEWDDTQAQAYVIDSRRKFLSLEDNVHHQFGFKLKEVSNIDRSRIVEYKLDQILTYNALDVKYTHALYKQFKKIIKKEGLQKPHKEQVERIPTMVLTKQKGLVVDFDKNEEFQDYLTKEMDRMYDEINRLEVVKQYKKKERRGFNPFSQPETLKVFRDYLERSEIYVEDGKGGTKESVNEEVLNEIGHPLAELVLEIRKYAKLKATFVDPMNRDTGEIIHGDYKLHPNFNTTFTATGRLSSSSPNAQNYPKRKDKYIRRQVVAPENHWMVSIDYGQLEARIVAMVSGDTNLINYIWDGYDIHGAWAEWFAHKDPKLVGGAEYVNDKDALKKLRDVIKNGWVFPIIYGAQVKALAGYMGVDTELAQEGFNLFWERHPGIWEWQMKELETYRKYGYVELLTGRRRHEPLDQNKILNTNIQGSSSDVVVDGMNRLSKLALETKKQQFQPVMNIHDDLTFFLPKDTLEEDLDQILEVMLTPKYEWARVVPLLAEAEAGPNWADMEEILAIDSTEYW